jgi:two-component system, response regulator
MELMASPNILVIEDNADDSLVLVRQLKRAHLEDHVMVIENGKTALDYLLKATSVPLVLFLDLRLPGLGGVEVLKEIRRVDRLQEMPVIVMTGSSDPKDLRECNLLGVTAFLEKPVSLTTFIKTVAHLFPKVNAAK